MILTAEELQAITRRTQRPAQARMLVVLGIPFKLHPDGSLLVSRAAVEHLLGVKVQPKVRPQEPNWDALNA